MDMLRVNNNASAVSLGPGKAPNGEVSRMRDVGRNSRGVGGTRGEEGGVDTTEPESLLHAMLGVAEGAREQGVARRGQGRIRL
jgi:hypothetical protein